jgi:hypothetical protein
LRSQKGYLSTIRGIESVFIDQLDVFLLTKTGRRRTPTSSGKDGSSRTDDPPGEGGPDEATAFIAETVADLAKVARQHNLDVLVRLLEMTHMEAQERIRLRGKRNLS